MVQLQAKSKFGLKNQDHKNLAGHEHSESNFHLNSILQLVPGRARSGIISRGSSLKSFRSCGSASSIYCTFLETSFGIGDDDGQLKLCRAWDKVKGRRSSAEDAQSVADLTVQVKHAVDPFERHKAERDSLTGEEKRNLACYEQNR